MIDLTNITTLLLILAIGLIIALLIIVRLLINKINHLTAPKFGFLGKPLYLLIVVGSVAVTIFIATNINNQELNDVSASKEIQILLSAITVDDIGKDSLVEFMAIPVINQKRWGVYGTDTFDIYWSIVGPKVYSETKKSLNEINNGTFQKTVVKGDYSINVIVVYNNKTYSQSLNTSL